MKKRDLSERASRRAGPEDGLMVKGGAQSNNSNWIEEEKALGRSFPGIKEN